MNLFTKQKQTPDIENKLMVTKGEAEGGINQEYVINRYILPYIKQINNKDLLYSTGNYIQYLVINYNGKESKVKKYRYIHIYVPPNHFAVYLKPTKYCKSTVLQ